MYTIDYEYSDAKGHKHKMSLSTDNQEESEIIWETMVLVFNSMMRNGTLTHFAGFTDAKRKEVKAWAENLKS